VDALTVLDNYAAFTLRQKQALFCRELARLIAWVYTHPGWEVRFGEGYVADTDSRDGDHDGPHMAGGGHYTRLAMDLMLDVDGVWIRGWHAAWDAIGAQWRSQHPLCRWGGDFRSRDYNHFSLYHQGKA
jgi:hypothetical protein